MLIEAINIHKSYRIGKNAIQVLKGVDLKIKKNEWIAIIGASGSGKTTLLNILGTLETSDKGSVSFNGKSYTRMNNKAKAAFRSQNIGFIFQSYHMFPELSIVENVKLPSTLRFPRNTLRHQPEELLQMVGLEHRMNHKPTELSGGEQQRAAIARALINSPDLILADEPTGNLDSKAGGEILEIFKTLHNSELKTTIVMITHDMNIADYAERKVHLKDGKIEQ